MATAIKPFFRPLRSRKVKPLSQSSTQHQLQKAAPQKPFELKEEQFVVEWWANLLPREQRFVDALIRQKLRQMVPSPWQVTGPLWGFARRFIVTQLVEAEVVLSEAVLSFEEEMESACQLTERGEWYEYE